jgi:hypothetical protein
MSGLYAFGHYHPYMSVKRTKSRVTGEPFGKILLYSLKIRVGDEISDAN